MCCLKLYNYFQLYTSSQFYSEGRAICDKTANISVLDLFAGNGGLQDVLAADDPDGLVVDIDGVDERRDPRVLQAQAGFRTLNIVVGNSERSIAKRSGVA
jgi:hypothetical protein